MARWSSLPDEVERARTLTIDFFIKNKVLKPNTNNSGSVIWTSSSGTKNSIGYWLHTSDEDGFIRIHYTHNEKQKISYDISLIARQSNLGKGLIWFFVCPSTNKVCRKLHLKSGYFLHRTAFKNFYYQQQVQSKRNRFFYSRSFADAFRDDLDNDLYKKYLKKHYKGKVTRTFKKLLARKRKAENVDLAAFSSVFGIQMKKS